MTRWIYKARYALMMMIFGFVSVLLLTKNIDAFNALPVYTQALLVLGLILVCLFLIWKDQNSNLRVNRNIALDGRKYGNSPRFAQGPVSAEFKKLLADRIDAAADNSQLEQLLDDIHDAALTCRNDPDGLRAAVEMLKEA